VLGDSTGNDVNEWAYTLAAAIGADYPAWTVDHRLWNDATQAYAAPTRLQTGAAGERFMDLSAATYGRRMPLGFAPALTGIIDARVKLSAATWADGVSTTDLMCHEAGYNYRCWWFYLASDGSPSFQYSLDGVAVQSAIGPFASTTLAAGSTGWLRVLFNPNDGAGNRVTKFYESVDGIAWTQIGATITTAGVVVLFDTPVAIYVIGGRASVGVVHGTKIYEVQLRDGDNGKCVTPCLPDQWSRFESGVADSLVTGAPVLTFVNGSQSGADITYLGDVTRLPKLTPDYGQVLTFLSDSHNEHWVQGAWWQGLYAAWVTSVKARLPIAPIVALTQNPEQATFVLATGHASRRISLLAFARSLGIGVIDTFKAFTDNAAGSTTLMLDDVHPNATGSALWMNTIKALLDKAA